MYAPLSLMAIFSVQLYKHKHQ